MTATAAVLSGMLARREVMPTQRFLADLTAALDRLPNSPAVVEALTRVRDVARNAPHCSARELAWLHEAVERCFDDLTPALGLTGDAT